ncbi:MAG: GerMN domain-containing protein [Lachnospiraceae bacterium]|nr:GerMN domain-containing protein [Lachnospiraceae bacterium]
MKRRNRCRILLLAVAIASCLAGCGKSNGEEESGNAYQIYYLNKAETKIVAEDFRTEETDTEKLISLLLGQLAKTPHDAELRTTMPDSIEYNGYVLSDGQLSMDFGRGYSRQTPTVEVLTRAAIVRTLCQIKEVGYVSFTVGRHALLNQSGSPVGVMSEDMFVENAGNEINTYETAQLTLYYADEDGQRLIKVTREEVYNSNISLERLVVDKIIAGPNDQEQDAFAAVNPETKVLSVTAKDGICYVNLDSTFLTQVDTVMPDVTIYALVNSLIELSNINKVQISIDGQTNVFYKESISLENPLERNFELVKE